jgi:diguanylate cyclase (GGDEF)-like protein/PAS domain S-box-containing protein
LLSGKKLEVNEYTTIKKNGTTFPILIYGSPKYKNGEIVGTHGVVVDISKLKNIEKTLLKSQQEFSSLFKSSPEALVYIDENSKILDINAQFTKLFGYTLEEIKGKNVDDGIVHSQKTIHEGKILTKKALKGFVNYETIRKRKDGSEFPVFISSSPVKINNKLKGIITLYQDITERKQNEKVQQILYNISKAANSTISLKELYPIIHKELHKIIDATNFYISLLDEKENKLYFPYYRDEMDIFPPKGKDATGMISTYMIKNNKSLLLGSKQVKEMGSQGKVDISKIGVFSDKTHWLGVPLKVEDKTIGIMVVQSYANPNLYNKNDLKLMEFVSEQVATAIERKRTEEALQASQQEFSNLFNSSPEAAIYHDEKGMILNINPRFTELFGYTLEEAKGKNINEGMIFPQNNTVKESEKLTRLALEGKVVTFETIRKKKNNSLISVIISVALVITEGRHRGVIAFYKDITERKKAEEELRQSEEKFAGIFKNVPDAAIYLDTEGTILDVNPVFTRLFDYTKEDMLGKNIDEIGLYPKGKIKEGKDLTRKTLNEDLTNFETVRQKRDGTLVPVRISTSFVKIKDKIAGIIALYQDITERKQNEQLQQVLYNISKAANSLITLNQLYKTIHQELGTVIDTTNFYIALLDEKENKIYFPYHVDEMGDEFEPQNLEYKSLTCYIIRDKRSLLLNYDKIKKLNENGELLNPGIVTKNIFWFGVPLKVEGKVIGAMAVQSYTKPNLYSEKDTTLLEFVSSQVATAIERKRMEEELKKLAHHDPLTGTYNRGYGLELLQRQVKLAKRNKTSFLLAYTDLDNLKKINDEFGHEEGDKAIAKVANLFQSILREVDIIIRMGGDEFLLIFSESSAKEIPVIRKRLYDKLTRQNWVSNKPYKIGFSTGFSCYDPEHPKSIEELIYISDQKMYKSKKE